MTAETSSFYHSGIDVKSDEPSWAANAKDGTDAAVRPLKLCSCGEKITTMEAGASTTAADIVPSFQGASLFIQNPDYC